MGTQQTQTFLESAQQGAYFIDLGITAELRKLNFPETAINSLENCGLWDGHYTFWDCNCNSGYILRKRHCDNRLCPVCLKRRRFRVSRQIKQFLKTSWNTPTYKWRFFTISPVNVFNLEQGLIDIKAKFKRFLNAPYSTSFNSRGHLKVDQYVKDRIKGGIYVIEVTKGEVNDYHIHIHGIFYSSLIDFQYRGKCMACPQNKLRWDSEQKKPYCANSKCNSYHVIPFENNKCQRIWRKVNNESCRFDGRDIDSFQGAVNYLTKYLTMDKSHFIDNKDIALYMNAVYRKKTLISFGVFYGTKIFTGKFDIVCPFCGSRIKFSRDEDFEYCIKKGVLPPRTIFVLKSPVSKDCIRPRVKW